MIIVCPHCGKQVSDECDVCIHCGGQIAFSKNRFEKYSKEERDRLHEEFLATHERYNYGETGYRQSKRASFLFAGIAFLNGLLFILSKSYAPATEEMNTILLSGAVAGIIVMILCCIGLIGTLISRKRYLGKMLLAEKIFQAWLKREKGILYEVPFSASNKKYKRIFDAINIDQYPY